MKIFRSLIFSLLLGVSFLTSYSTDFQLIQYRVEDGLNTDIIKCVAEDSYGFIWIGTDEGLIQYNGKQFINYPKATNSPFIKDFITLKDGRLLVLEDLGLNEIINQIDTVVFKPILAGTRQPTDSTIWYPKSIFEDSKGNLWIGEPQSIVKYDGKKLQRFTLGSEYNSSSFVRSFNFVELPDGRILISSYSGGFLIYDYVTKQLQPLKNTDFFDDVSHMIQWNDEVYIASNYGVFKVTSLTNREITTKQINRVDGASYLLPLNENELLVSSFLNPPLIYQKGKEFTALPYSLIAMNQAFKSREGNIWFSTEKGLVLLVPQIFKKVNTESENTYVETVVQAQDRQKVYFASKEHIRTYEIGQLKANIFDVHLRGYFLSLQLDGDKLWASNAQNIFLYNTSGKLKSTWDLSGDGRYIFDIFLDRDHNLWLTQEASIGLKCIDKQGKVHFYKESNGLNEELTVVRTGPKGIYSGSNNMLSYLYFKSYDDSVFVNLSKPIKFPIVGDFRIEDIALDGETIWLATSVGVLKQNADGIQKISLDKKFDNLLVKIIRVQKNSPFIWFSTAYGLVQYNQVTGEYNVYDESHGLPSNTVNSRGLIVNKDRIWVGTASGLAYSNYNFLDLKETPKPFIVKFYADDKLYLKRTLNKLHLPPHPNVAIYFSSPSYPANKVRYQYKMLNRDSSWRDLSSTNGISLSKLKGGNYNLVVRAKKYGNYKWSKSRELNFKVGKAYYETVYFKIAIFLIAIALIFVTRYTTTQILKKRQEVLEKLVAERTTELAKANENLLARNQELDQFVYSTSHDLSAPLKSIRGLINIANVEPDQEEQKSLLKKMNESVIKLEKFIRDVISYSRNARLEVKKEAIVLKDLVSEIIENISNLEHFNEIKFITNIDDVTIYSDETRIKIILNNLISNAVKFQRIGEEKNPQVAISYRFENKMHHIEVSDNGQGIPKEFTNKIFNMFYRANVSSDGSGLGLYILQETINKLHGEVLVKSEEGAGSTFTVRFH